MPGFITGYLGGSSSRRRARRRAQHHQISTNAESSQNDPEPIDFEETYASLIETLRAIDDFNRSYTTPIILERHVHFVPFCRPPATPWIICNLDSRFADEEMIQNESTSACSICLEVFTLGVEVSVLSCRHFFHFDCIQRWICESNSCPICRDGRALARRSRNCRCGANEACF